MKSSFGMRIVQSKKGVAVDMEVPEGSLNIFIGANNSGKSSLLRAIDATINKSTCCYISPQRFSVADKVPSVDKGKQENHRIKVLNAVRNDRDGNESPSDDFVDLLAGLRADVADRAIGWINGNLPTKITVDRPSHMFYPIPTIAIDGRIPSLQGTGVRSMLNCIVRIFDPAFDTLLIDEPELSIEPKAQKKFFELLKDVSKGTVDGVSMKKIYLATHSHLFVDRETLENNWTVEKGADEQIGIKQLTSTTDLHRTVFNLLGGSPTDLFMPANIVVVEGKSDYIFIKYLLEKLLDERGIHKDIAVHFAGSDNEIPLALKSLDQVLKFNASISLYKAKMCGFFDKQKKSQWISDACGLLGLEPSDTDTPIRIRRLTVDHVEQCYPVDVLASVAQIVASEIASPLNTFIEQTKNGGNGVGEFGRFRGTKTQLAQKVVQVMRRREHCFDALAASGDEIRETLEWAISNAY